MKTTNLFIFLAAFVCFFLLPQQASGQARLEGFTSISYNAFTNTVTGVSTTQLDYAAQDWYQARASSTLTDATGAVLASASAYDVDRDGTITVTTQTTGVDQMEYKNTSRHFAKVDIQDYSIGTYYVDYWNFQEVAGRESGSYYYLYMPFYAYGPRKNTRLTNLLISNTFATVQAKPRIDAGTPTATPNPVTTTNPQSSLTAPITASTVGLEQGDFAVVEVINDTAGGTVTYADGPVKNVPLVLGGTTTVTFNVTSATVGSHTLRVRIADIMRPNPNGPPTSILSRTAVDPNGKTTIFTVNP